MEGERERLREHREIWNGTERLREHREIWNGTERLREEEFCPIRFIFFFYLLFTLSVVKNPLIPFK